jgi:hypothetical protein
MVTCPSRYCQRALEQTYSIAVFSRDSTILQSTSHKEGMFIFSVTVPHVCIFELIRVQNAEIQRARMLPIHWYSISLV